MDESRLHRIENKLDKLAEAVVSLARMEERMVTLFNRMERYEGRQEGLEARIDEVETTFGFKTVEWKTETGFWLNGENVKLKGTCEHWEGGPVGGAWTKPMLRWKLVSVWRSWWNRCVQRVRSK